MAIPAMLIAIGSMATLEALKNFYKNYKTSKSISTDPEEPTTTDDFDGYECNGFRLSSDTASGIHYYYKTVSFNGNTYSNLEPHVGGRGFSFYKNGVKYDFSSTGADRLSALGFIFVDSTGRGTVSLGGAFLVGSASSSWWSWDDICDAFECTPATVSQSTQASINLETWNANVDWLEDLIDSGSTDGVSIDSDSYTEVTDPDELADTIMDAITDNDYEGTLAEIPEPISYATTVKAALDDIYTQYEKTVRWTSVPESASATGIKGQMARDTSYLYICVATDTWTRLALESIT